MKIAFASHLDPLDLRTYSGTTAHAIGALRDAGAVVTPIGPLREPARAWFNLKHAYYKLTGRSYARDREPRVLRSYARQVKAQIGDADVVVSSGGVAVARLECSQPIVVWTDATFAAMVGFYWNDLAPESLRKGLAMEREVMARCRLAIFSSRWAADSAVRDCGADPDRVRIVEYGANLGEGPPPTGDEVREMIASRPRGRCDLLFVGVEWERKGAATAIEVARELNDSGLPTTLRLAGCQPPPGVVLPKFVEPTGFIDKSTPAGMEQARRLFGQAHFLILPSRAEACAMVLAEACAFGLPPLATDVGGIPTAVRDGHNGLLFELDAPARRWAGQVRMTLDEPREYAALCANARREYETRLNWKSAGERVMRLLKEIV